MNCFILKFCSSYCLSQVNVVQLVVFLGSVKARTAKLSHVNSKFERERDKLSLQ